jgi:hypothetical protein
MEMYSSIGPVHPSECFLGVSRRLRSQAKRATAFFEVHVIDILLFGLTSRSGSP